MSEDKNATVEFDADDAEEFWRNNAWNEESLLKDFKDASGVAKWSAMRKLVEKYFDENGFDGEIETPDGRTALKNHLKSKSKILKSEKLTR